MFFSILFFLFSFSGPQIWVSGQSARPARWFSCLFLSGPVFTGVLCLCFMSCPPPRLSRLPVVGLTSRSSCRVSSSVFPALCTCGLGCDSCALRQTRPGSGSWWLSSRAPVWPELCRPALLGWTPDVVRFASLGVGCFCDPKSSPSFGASGNHVSRTLFWSTFLSVGIGFRCCDLSARLLQPAVLVAGGGGLCRSSASTRDMACQPRQGGRLPDACCPARPVRACHPWRPPPAVPWWGDRSCLDGPWLDSWVLKGCCQPPTQRGRGLLCFLQAHVPCLHS